MFFKAARAVYFPEVPTNLTVLAAPRFVPGRVQKKRQEAPKIDVRDSYLEDADLKKFGFMSNKAREQHEGSVKHLTDLDVEALIDRGCWGGKTRRGKEAQAQTAICKAMWHDGAMVFDVMSSMNKSESWVEHRFAAFNAALSIENSQTS